MRLLKLQISGFRGIRTGNFSFSKHCVVIGPNGCGKSSLIDAISLVLGRTKMVRQLTELDFFGSSPKPVDRIRIVGTISGFPSQKAEDNCDWFRADRAIPKWIDKSGKLYSTPSSDRFLCVQIGFAARFDFTELSVETIRYFHDDDDTLDPFLIPEAIQQIPNHLLNDIGCYVLPAKRGWEGIASFNSELFRRAITDIGGIPAEEVLKQRDQVRSPEKPLEMSEQIKGLAKHINDQLSRLLIQHPEFRLRLTAGDTESVLQALLPHYLCNGVTLPVSRHGAGLLSLQTMVLLLEIGRARKQKQLPFLLTLEEPELHLAPGIQSRMVAEAMQVSEQTICTTHSPRVAALYQPTDVLVMNSNGSEISARPFLDIPLTQSASNNERKYYFLNSARIVEALMHSIVLVPEGRFDCEWLGRLSAVGEHNQKKVPFSSLFGIIPTENAAVAFTVEKILQLRGGLMVLIDGDKAGDDYLEKLKSLSKPPDVVVQWPQNWTIEDVLGWILSAAEDAVINDIRGALPEWEFDDVCGLVSILKIPNNRASGTRGLKEDIIAHEIITESIREQPDCANRLGEILDALVSSAAFENHKFLQEMTKESASPRLLRINPE